MVTWPTSVNFRISKITLKHGPLDFIHTCESWSSYIKLYLSSNIFSTNTDLLVILYLILYFIPSFMKDWIIASMTGQGNKDTIQSSGKYSQRRNDKIQIMFIFFFFTLLTAKYRFAGKKVSLFFLCPKGGPLQGVKKSNFFPRNVLFFLEM